MPLTTNLFPASINTEFMMAVAYGLVKGYSRVAAFGINASIDTGTSEDIWPGGGLYPWMTAATSLEIVSDNTNDTSAGTGARTILIQGLDINYVPVTQTITLNGTNAVSIPTQLYRINTVLVMSAGSSLTNIGAITIRNAGAGTTRTVIRAGFGIAQHANYTVPAGFTLQVMSIYISLTGNGVSRNADVATYFAPNAAFYRLPLTLNTSDGNPYRHDGAHIMAAEKTDFNLRGLSVSNNSTGVSAAWLGVLKQN